MQLYVVRAFVEGLLKFPVTQLFKPHEALVIRSMTTEGLVSNVIGIPYVAPVLHHLSSLLRSSSHWMVTPVDFLEAPYFLPFPHVIIMQDTIPYKKLT